MEVYTGTVNEAVFNYPSNQTSVSDLKMVAADGTEKTVAFIPGNGKATASIPFQSKDATVKLVWTFNVGGTGPHKKIQYFDFITPIVEIEELQDHLGSTRVDAEKAEKAARHVIQANTGQEFGHSYKALTVAGRNETALQLPERLINIDKFETSSAVLNHEGIIIAGDGWYLKKKWLEELEGKVGGSSYFGESDRGGVIYAPALSSGPTVWKRDYPFTITGNWGYERVPQAVVEAAKLLASDFSCRDITYRDRYLDSIRSADWRLEFNGKAWINTGNARADLLLSEYIVLDWLVI